MSDVTNTYIQNEGFSIKPIRYEYRIESIELRQVALPNRKINKIADEGWVYKETIAASPSVAVMLFYRIKLEE